jgi:tetratricopeptide (TPR) repeat protein
VKRSSNRQSAIGTRHSDVPSLIERVLNGIVVFFAALAVVLRPLIGSHREDANLWVGMCVVIAAAAWLGHMAAVRRLRLARTGMGLPALALLALAAVSTFRSPYPMASINRLLDWLSYAALFFVLVNATAEGGLDRRFFLRLLWASAFAVAVYGLFQQFVSFPLMRREIEAHPVRVLTDLRMGEEFLGDLMARASGRIFGTFLLSNTFAGFLALVVPGFVGYVLDRLRSGDRGKAFLGASALWVAGALACLLLTYSKGGWVAFGVGMLAFCAVLGKDLLRRHARLLLGVAAAAVAAFALLLALRIVPTQIFRDAIPSLGVRAGYWRGAMDMALDHPLGGVGLATFGSHYPRYRPLLGHPAQEAHNDYLQVLAELGVPGLLAFLWLWLAYLRNASAKGEAGGRAVRCRGESRIRPYLGEHEVRPYADAQHQTPSTLRPSSAAFPFWTGCAAGVLAFALSAAVAGTFALDGSSDEAPEMRFWANWGLTAGFAGAWLLFFLALGRGEAAAPGELCRRGLLCGVVAFLVHCAADFDYTQPGVALSAWVVAALSVRPRGRAVERRASPVAATALAACALAAFGGFYLLFISRTRAVEDREVAGALVSEAVRERTPERAERVLQEARQLYERALRASPLDASLHVEVGGFLIWRLAPLDREPPGGKRPPLRVRIETEEDVTLFRRAVELSLWIFLPRRPESDVTLFRRAVALFRRAAELNRASAAPHHQLGKLFQAAAADDAGARAHAALEPFVASCPAPKPKAGTNRLFLPAVAEHEAALERGPNDPKLLLHLAEALKAYGDAEAAAAKASRAIEISRMLHESEPGHKLILTFDESQRALDVIRSTEPEGAAP